MKRITAAALSLIMCFVFACGVSAAAVKLENPKLSVTMPEGFVSITIDNVKQQAAYIEHIGNTVSGFKKYMEDNNIYIYAASPDNADQFQLKVRETELSKYIGNLSDCSDEELSVAEDELSGNLSEDGLLINRYRVSVGDMMFLKMSARTPAGESATENPYCSVHYITVVNKMLFTLTYYNAASELSEQQLSLADSVAATFKVTKQKEIEPKSVINIVYVVIIAAATVILIAIIVILIISVARDIQKARQSKENVTVHIKRRK